MLMERDTQQPLLIISDNRKPSDSKDVERGVSCFMTSPRFSIRSVVVAAILGMLFITLLVFFYVVWSCQSSYMFFTGIWNKESKADYFDPISYSLYHRIRAISSLPFDYDPEGVFIPKGRTPDHIVKNLSYVMDEEPVRDRFNQSSSLFGGHLSWTKREESFKLNSSMKVQCGFMRNGGGEMDPVDIEYAKKCRFVVVSAIFGQNDVPRQPSSLSHRSKKRFCFLMVVDEVSLNFIEENNFVRQDYNGGRWIGIWRLVLLKHPPYDDPSRNEKVPKILTHRLFPQAQYSIWIDGKIELMADPLQLLDRYLWVGKNTFAIAEHKCHPSIYDEAEHIKLQKRYARPFIDLQMKIYYYEGMKPWSSKNTTISGSVIIREHTAMNNLFSCLWFNEVNLFTPMDQLSFGYVWYRLGDAFKFFMFPNWEYHALTKFHYTGGDFSPQQCVKERSDFWGNGSSMIENRDGLGLWTPYPGDLDSVSLPKLALEDQKKADFLIPYPEDLDSVVLPKAVEVEIF